MHDIIRTARQAGVTLSVTGPETLNANPSSKVTPELASLIRTHKWALMEHLLEAEGDALITEWASHEDTLVAAQTTVYEAEHQRICRWLDALQQRSGVAA